MAADQRGIVQDMGELVAKAVENQHFDKVALGMARKLYKMAKDRPERFAITLQHLLSYIDDLELDRIADQNRGLPLDDEAGADEAGETADDAPKPGLSVVPKPMFEDDAAA